MSVAHRYVFTLFIVGITILLGACTEEESAVPETVNKTDLKGTIVAVGDSLTAGMGVNESEAYPAKLEKKLAENGLMYNVINAGISGETSSGALSRIKWIMTLNPDIVILETGANDGLRGINPALTRSNIRKMIRILKARDIVVVLAGMQMVRNLGESYTKAFQEMYPSLAEEEGVIFIPFFLRGVAGEADLNQPDGIHPTAEGYTRVVETVYPYVIEAVGILAP